jgi:hypothetical protein
LDAELVVTTLLLPERFEFFSQSLGENKFSILDSDSCGGKFLKLSTVRAVRGNSKITFVLIGT